MARLPSTDSGERRDPLSTLRDIARRHDELNARLTDLDREQSAAVREARNAGYGWQMIASALGVTRQAVHKKYGRR